MRNSCVTAVTAITAAIAVTTVTAITAITDITALYTAQSHDILSPPRKRGGALGQDAE